MSQRSTNDSTPTCIVRHKQPRPKLLPPQGGQFTEAIYKLDAEWGAVSDKRFVYRALRMHHCKQVLDGLTPEQLDAWLTMGRHIVEGMPVHAAAVETHIELGSTRDKAEAIATKVSGRTA